MAGITFKTERFEGPLDLLLSLVSQHKMKLSDICILELIDQYLAAIGTLTPEELNDATEFVEMAARLVYLKSVALLPRSEEREKLERELTGELIEYSLCKLAARRLGDMSIGMVFYVREPMKPLRPAEYTVRHEPEALLEAYLAVNKKKLGRREPTALDITDVVAAPIVPISTGILHILRGVRRGQVSSVHDMFAGVVGRSEAVATFLALLELIRAGRLAVADDGGVALLKKERTNG